MKLQLFQFENNEIQIYFDDRGDPYWIAHEIGKLLEIKNPRDVVARLDNDEKGVVLIDTPGGTQQVTTINESGLYEFVFSSRKPTAQRFKKWIRKVVLPQIRKTGSYGLPTDPKQQALLLAQTVLEQNKQIESLEAKIEQDQPRVDYCNLVTNTEGNMMLSAWWKEVDGEKWEGTVFDVFLYKGWLMWTEIGGKRRRVPKMDLVRKGFLTLKHHQFEYNSGGKEKSPTILITPSGKLYFAERLGMINQQLDLFGG
jgi:anti-repressor protein